MEKTNTYVVKCRSCGSKETMHHSRVENVDPKMFERWALEHSTFPIAKQCKCDNGSLMFHDLISYSLPL